MIDFIRKYFPLFCKGVAMGAADVVPGVSGGTIAFITGIYAQLLEAIRAFNLTSLKMLYRGDFVAFWIHVHGTFLTVLFSGILFSIASFAHLLIYLLGHYPLLVWGFFFGLIMASAIYIWRQIPVNSPGNWFLFLSGVVAASGLAFARHVEIDASPLNVFGAGMLAICAMILPGISGSFILLLLGMYAVILEAVVVRDLPLLVVFVAGCVTGLLLFARLIGWLLARYHSLTMSTLAGFLLGSLAMVWPWRQSVEQGDLAGQNSAGLQLYWPGDYAVALGDDPQRLSVITLMLMGMALVFILEYAGGGHREPL